MGYSISAARWDCVQSWRGKKTIGRPSVSLKCRTIYITVFKSPFLVAVTQFQRYSWRNSPKESGGDSPRRIFACSQREEGASTKKIPGICVRNWKDILIPATATNWTTAFWRLPSLRSSSLAVYRLTPGEPERRRGSRVIAPPGSPKECALPLRTELTLTSRQEAGWGTVSGSMTRSQVKQSFLFQVLYP